MLIGQKVDLQNQLVTVKEQLKKVGAVPASSTKYSMTCSDMFPAVALSETVSIENACYRLRDCHRKARRPQPKFRRCSERKTQVYRINW